MQDILNALKIVDVYTFLTGYAPRRSGNCFRGKATWRNGDGFNVSLDNDRGVWHDFATDDGGGILDLIVRIRGGSRRDALIWASEFSGIPLETKEFTPEERLEWVEARKATERDLPEARYWRRAALNMTEDALTHLKAKLFDPMPPDPEDLSEPVMPCGDGIYDLEQLLSRLNRMGEAELIEDFRWWRDHFPGIANAMIKTAKHQESLERRVVLRLIREMKHGAS